MDDCKIARWEANPPPDGKIPGKKASANQLDDASRQEIASKLQLLCDRTVNRHRWSRRVSSGARENDRKGTRQNNPVTSEEGVPRKGPQ